MNLLRKIPETILVLLLLCSSSSGQTVKGEIVQQQVDVSGNGYSLIKVWGTYAEMGYAHGYLLADVVNMEIASLKKLLGVGYASIKKQVGGSVFPADATEEINGIITGILAKTPSSTVDAGDLKVLNTYADWVTLAAAEAIRAGVLMFPLRSKPCLPEEAIIVESRLPDC